MFKFQKIQIFIIFNLVLLMFQDDWQNVRDRGRLQRVLAEKVELRSQYGLQFLSLVAIKLKILLIYYQIIISLSNTILVEITVIPKRRYL